MCVCVCACGQTEDVDADRAPEGSGKAVTQAEPQASIASTRDQKKKGGKKTVADAPPGEGERVDDMEMAADEDKKEKVYCARMCTCMRTYVYMHAHVCMHACIHKHVNTSAHACMHTYIDTHTCTHTHTHTHKLTHTHTHIHTRTNKHTYKHEKTYALEYAHAHTHTHTHTHTNRARGGVTKRAKPQKNPRPSRERTLARVCWQVWVGRRR